MIAKMLDGIDVMLGVDFAEIKDYQHKLARKTVFTGMIDEYFDFCFGHLKYRTLCFETERVENKTYQKSAVVNYTEKAVPYTRIIDHKQFEFGDQDFSVVTKEYPAEWKEGSIPYYAINDDENNKLYKKYAQLAQKDGDVIFGGRLGTYSYLDMDKTIEAAFALAEQERYDKAL